MLFSLTGFELIYLPKLLSHHHMHLSGIHSVHHRPLCIPLGDFLQQPETHSFRLYHDYTATLAANKLTDAYVEKVNTILKKKEGEIMEV